MATGSRSASRPAAEFERSVATAAAMVLDDRTAILADIEHSGSDATRTKSMLEAASAWSKRLRSEAEAPAALDLLVDRVELRPDDIQLSIKLPTESSEKLVGCAPAPLKLTRLIPLKMRRRGVEMKFAVNGDSKALQNELMPCKSKPSESPSGPKHPDWPRTFRGHSSCFTIKWRLPH